MKYLATLIAGLGLYCASVSCHAPTSEGSTSATAEATVEAAIKPFTFDITGMTWGVSCVRRVRTTLEGQPGVETVKVDFDNKVAHLTVNSGFDPFKAAAALATEGYGATVQ